ncbi:Flavin-dependent monooxygenase, reductase subunit HsaB [Streptomyces sp. YIM 130001]|uniref:flavin reductase family protein n=1 Tax=Streptomyces sp. YIM 130001 TaxID=2259644 RepID=UPI000E65BE1D|nr:flavin reductase family protein [Streptomyces sp. YIM 130001]RII14684.1 Flavin-dependent monooxygenase, reductase subunit HsaB [Streptomyces sp. YIM 130001]
MTATTHHRPTPATPLRQTTADPAPPAPEGAEILRATLRRHASGVAVITVPGPAGFTATSFTSVSLRPALVSFCLGLGASSLPAVQSADRFAVHILGSENAELAAQFARSGIDRFAGVPSETQPDGLPLLGGVGAWLTARVTLRQPVGDHLLVVGEVDSGAVTAGDSGLVHHNGAFATPTPLG